jgi:hypothetical protein
MNDPACLAKLSLAERGVGRLENAKYDHTGTEVVSALAGVYGQTNGPQAVITTGKAPADFAGVLLTVDELADRTGLTLLRVECTAALEITSFTGQNSVYLPNECLDMSSMAMLIRLLEDVVEPIRGGVTQVSIHRRTLQHMGAYATNGASGKFLTLWCVGEGEDEKKLNQWLDRVLGVGYFSKDFPGGERKGKAGDPPFLARLAPVWSRLAHLATRSRL